MNDMDPNSECALWYWYHHSVDYELFETEEEAADGALYKEDYETGVPIGVQFSDGRTIAAEQWPALIEARRRQREEWEREREQARLNPPPPRPTRIVRDPFEGREVKIEIDEPDWLGQT